MWLIAAFSDECCRLCRVAAGSTTLHVASGLARFLVWDCTKLQTLAQAKLWNGLKSESKAGRSDLEKHPPCASVPWWKDQSSSCAALLWVSEGQRELGVCQDPEKAIYVGLSWLGEASTLPSAAPEEVMSQITAWWFFWLGGAGFLWLPLLPLLQQHPAV